MTDLTEQWKKGELPLGWYYIQEQNGDIQIDYCSRVEVDRGRIVYELEWEEFELTFSRVLASVPSYEEYEQLENWNRFTADYHALREAKEIAEYEKVEFMETVEALKSELKEVCDVLIRKCPEMKEWVMLNWKNLYELEK